MPSTFDLDSIEPEERQPALRELLQQNPVPIDVATGSIDQLHVSTTAEFFGALFMVSCDGRGAVVHRGERRVQEDHARTMMLSVVASGRSVFRHNDTITDARSGDVVPYASTLPYSATFDDVAKHTFMIDYAALQLPERTLEAQLGRPINKGHTLGRIVAGYLAEVATEAIHLADEQRRALEQPSLDLLRALFATTAGHDSRAVEPLHSTLGVRMITYLKMHLREPDLTMARLAREHGISERYAYLILARQGVQLADWIRAERLAGAAEDLKDPTAASQPVAAVAKSWGFPDQANFTRAFRRLYGMSPREYRHQT